jgi:hypothetical protein
MIQATARARAVASRARRLIAGQFSLVTGQKLMEA